MCQLDLSGKIDAYTLALYKHIISAANALEMQFFVVGATARDLILERNYNIRPFRATEDIDLGFQVADWKQFVDLKGLLIQTGKFRSSKLVHRLIYDEIHPVDIVPFGDIGSPENQIAWPPDQAIRMNIQGLAESYQDACNVVLRKNPFLEIKVASLPGQAILKIFSWKDRGAENDKDANDLAIILQNYALAGNEDRLYNEDVEILVIEDFDVDNAAAHLLGSDVEKICSTELKHSLLDILEAEISEQGDYTLVAAMRNSVLGDDFERNLILLEKFNSGLRGE